MSNFVDRHEQTPTDTNKHRQTGTDKNREKKNIIILQNSLG